MGDRKPNVAELRQKYQSLVDSSVLTRRTLAVEVVSNGWMIISNESSHMTVLLPEGGRFRVTFDRKQPKSSSAPSVKNANQIYYIYLLYAVSKSKNEIQAYVGFTTDLHKKVESHNKDEPSLDDKGKPRNASEVYSYALDNKLSVFVSLLDSTCDKRFVPFLRSFWTSTIGDLVEVPSKSRLPKSVSTYTGLPIYEPDVLAKVFKSVFDSGIDTKIFDREKAESLQSAVSLVV